MVGPVVRCFKSGKEAWVHIVACGNQLRCAKVDKEAEDRGFHRLAQYKEGRKTRGSRDARVMGKRGRHSRRAQEAEWTNVEVDVLYRMAGVGVLVPAPHLVHEGVLLMELILDENGSRAPRLNDATSTRPLCGADTLEWGNRYLFCETKRMERHLTKCASMLRIFNPGGRDGFEEFRGCKHTR
jgi:serine/threonine-protein kinase RIO1